MCDTDEEMVHTREEQSATDQKPNFKRLHDFRLGGAPKAKVASRVSSGKIAQTLMGQIPTSKGMGRRRQQQTRRKLKQEKKGQLVSQETKLMQQETERMVKICTWNVCLGARCKMPIIKDLLNKNDIDIFCIQEAYIKTDEELDFYQISNYCLEVESVTQQYTRRTLMHIKSDLSC